MPMLLEVRRTLRSGPSQYRVLGTRLTCLQQMTLASQVVLNRSWVSTHDEGKTMKALCSLLQLSLRLI